MKPLTLKDVLYALEHDGQKMMRRAMWTLARGEPQWVLMDSGLGVPHRVAQTAITDHHIVMLSGSEDHALYGWTRP